MRVKVVEEVIFPDVPEIVTNDVPIAAELAAVSLTWLFPVVGFGAMLALTPPGKPEMLRLTGFVNP